MGRITLTTHRHYHAPRRFGARAVGSVALAVLTVTAAGCSTSTSTTGAGLPRTAAASARAVPVFADYYLWWDAPHWRSKLGAAYPTRSKSLPLPAQLAPNGCDASTQYAGNTLTDVPAANLGLYTQDDPTTIRRQVTLAASAGLDGFVVSWSGNGRADQTDNSTAFNRRLALLVRAARAHNVEASRPFTLMLGYEGLDNSRNTRPTDWIRNDLAYFVRRYANDSEFRVPAYGTKPVVEFLDSRKFAPETLHGLLDPLHSKLTLIGDEHGTAEWNRGVATVFDGDSWYWSDENPYTNRRAAATVEHLSQTLHDEHKLWFAPITPGYNKSSLGRNGSCVPRNGIGTLQRLYATNAQSSPQGWTVISWNEYFENTYIEPSRRYGTTYIDALRNLFH